MNLQDTNGNVMQMESIHYLSRLRKWEYMISTIERDFIVKDGAASFPMKEYPNYCGIEDIGYISHGEWVDAELEYNGILHNASFTTGSMYKRFIEDFPEKDGDYEAFSKYVYDHKDVVYEMLEWEANNYEIRSDNRCNFGCIY